MVISRAASAGAVALLLACGPAPGAWASPDLAKAVAAHNLKKIDKLLADSAATGGAAIDDADEDGRTALFHAAAQGDAPLIQRLIDKGAAVNRADNTGATPLIEAMRNPATQLPAVQLLLARGADLNASDKTGRTALMEAVLRAPRILDTDAQAAMVEALVAAGADPGRADASGAMAMHDAAMVGEPRKVLEKLLAVAKDPNATTLSGANVLMMAVQNRQRPNAEYLMAKGFRPVRIKAVDSPAGPKPEIAQDLAPRTNAIAQDWYGQYATRKGDPAAGKAAFAAAAADYDAAAEEARRLVGAYGRALTADQEARNKGRVAAGLMTVGLTALTLGAGYSVVMTPHFTNIVEADKQAIIDYQAEAAAMTARAAELRAKAAAS
jgi:ankyrin repeat protein